MKTITPKSILKLVLFMLIIFSENAFSHPKLPVDSNSTDCGSKMGDIKKTSTIKANSVKFKDNAAFKSNRNGTPKLKAVTRK